MSTPLESLQKPIDAKEMQEDLEFLKRRHIEKLESVIEILTKFRSKKDGSILPSPELVLRRAAYLGKLVDIKELLRQVKDLDINEKGTESQKTALDFAVSANKVSVIAFLRTLREKRRIIKEISEGQTITMKDEDLEICCDVPKNVKININCGDLIIRGSVADNVKISVSRTPLINIHHNDEKLIAEYAIRTEKGKIELGGGYMMEGEIQHIGDNVYRIGGREFQIPLVDEVPILKGNITITGLISDTTHIKADGSVRVNAKNFYCLNTRQSFNENELESLMMMLLRDKDCYENVALFKYILENMTESITAKHNSLGLHSVLVSVVRDNRQGYLQVLVNKNYDINVKHEFFDKDTALSVALKTNNIKCLEILLTAKTLELEGPMLSKICKKRFQALSDAEKLLIKFVYDSLPREELAEKICFIFPNMPKDLVNIIFSYLQNESLKRKLIEINQLAKIRELGAYIESDATAKLSASASTVSIGNAVLTMTPAYTLTQALNSQNLPAVSIALSSTKFTSKLE